MKEWSNMDHPLKGDAYSTIARMISADAVQIPVAAETNIDRTEFVKQMVNSGRKPKVQGWKFISGGYFQQILLLALGHMDRYADQLQMKKDEMARHAFMSACLALHVNLIPGPPPSAGNVGAPVTLPQWDRWSTFGQSGMELVINPTDARQRRNLLLQKEQDKVIANDQDAEWFACGITLQNIATVFKRTQRPADFLEPRMIDDKPGYIRDTYQWVYESLDFSKPLHMFALIYALITINHVPSVFIRIPNCKDSEVSTYEKTKHLLQETAWYDKTDTKRGTKQKNIFLTMVVTLIISLYEVNSPLREYHLRHKKLGSEYTKKHGMTATYCVHDSDI